MDSEGRQCRHEAVEVRRIENADDVPVCNFGIVDHELAAVIAIELNNRLGKGGSLSI